MKILIDLDKGDGEKLIELAQADMRSKTAMAKKMLSEAIRIAFDPSGLAAHACGFKGDTQSKGAA